MLSDLIGVMQSVRNWGGSQLERQGINPNRLVADAWCDFAYWRFHNGDLTAARQAFRRSLHDQVTARAAFYALLTGLPKPVVYSLRHIKQRAQEAVRGV
jgi:hypothetical protein